MMCNGTHLMCQLLDFCKYGLKNIIILLCSRSPFHFSMPGVDLTYVEPTHNPVGEVILLDKATGW
jgi:hypothetical protein